MTTPLLRVRDLRIQFAQPRPAVAGVDVDVAAGEIVALVGESGSGKSMTARAVIGLLPSGARCSGSIQLDGEEILGADDKRMAALRGSRIGLVFQEPQSALNPVRRIGWQLREAIRANSTVTRAEARDRAIELLQMVEIPEPEKRLDFYPHQLSGGQKQRVAIALALAGEPELLLADEPTTALDVTVQAEILDLLTGLRDRTGMGILLITHNMGVVAERADRVVVLNLGEVVEQAPTVDLFAAPQQVYTQQLLAAVPRMPEPAELSGGADDREPEVALSLDGVGVLFPARHGSPAFRAVRDVTLDVRRGEVLGLVGESGSGKTTLGRLVAGLVTPTEGTVTFEGRDLATLDAAPLREVRRDLALVHQDPAASLDPKMTVGATIAEPMAIHGVGTARSRKERAAELLEAVRLPSSTLNRLPHQLSGGQRQRVALARALSLSPRLVIADEPTSALDVSVQAEVLRLFAELQAQLGFACVFISHDLAVVHQVSDRVAVLRAGELVESGPVDVVYSAPRDEYTRALLTAVPVPDPSRRAPGQPTIDTLADEPTAAVLTEALT